MIVLAKGSVTKPDALAPYIDDVESSRPRAFSKPSTGAPPGPGCTCSSKIQRRR